MNYKQKKSYRLKGYDYRQLGYYFVTICTKNRMSWFGKIEKEGMLLSTVGTITKQMLKNIPEHFGHVELIETGILPDHIHAIIALRGKENVPWHVPTELRGVQSESLGSIINHFKGAVTREVRKQGFLSFTWQPRYHDRIIRSEKELDKLRHYVHYNAVKHADKGFMVNIPWLD